MDGSEIERFLECCEFFKGLNKSDIEKIAGLGKIEAYNAGEYIFQQHDFGEHLYIIAEGRVSLERTVDMGTRKGSVTIETLGKGRVLGCWSTLLGEPHFLMSSAVCQLPTKVVVLKGAVLREMMLENREIGFNIMERFCFLLRERIQAVYGALEKF
ncbi:MAG: Crp/Fnr family transcriptional regulator [Desulfobacteraceae bacterium IS3]|nr:MAG: Crp/Fnr family transcriptional regulator [Desulfobacteraceae bacterium IS3]